ncbi:pyridoxamine 5'-phosphate oxidase family protein [Agromyces silvae]|uniref:pyridoxamine 5'-phosphate oxidase family protein n=1 Tax=Agromyces silvae TaxID=3388266 RepID=UPI00280C1467|nr:pyridoxamine 5'-phosphate oxidase family protein [Agromyces protaetiae]
MTSFTDDDLEFLTRPLYLFFTAVPDGDRLPAPRPVWYELGEDGGLEMFSGASTARIRRLRRDPRASVVVTAPVGEPEYWVAAEGHVTLQADGAQELATRLSKRYWYPGVIEEWGGMDLIRLTFTPTRVQRAAG